MVPEDSPRSSTCEQTGLVRAQRPDTGPKGSEGVTGQRSLKLGARGEEWWGHEADLGDDAWGAAIVSLARSYPVIVMKVQAGHSIMLDLADLIVSVSVTIMNLVLQVAVLWYIWQFLVEPAVHKVQARYRSFRAHIHDRDGVFDLEAWHGYDGKSDICEIAMVNATFYYSILLLWILTNMSEWRSIEHLSRKLFSIHSVKEPSDQLLFTETGSFEKGGACLVHGLTPCVRAAIYLFVVMPRLLISIFLSWLGLRMLTSSASFSDMVLNSLALGFVISIDELLCQAILPGSIRKHMAETNLFIKEDTVPKTHAQVISSEWRGFMLTVLLLVISAIYLFLYGEILQEVLPVEIRQLGVHCQPYVHSVQQPICSQAAFYGGASCFPAGVGDTADDV